MRERFNRILDRLVRTEVVLGPRVFPAFAACGYAGFTAAVALAIALTRHAGLSFIVLFLMTVAGALTYIAVVAVTRIVTGAPQLTYYHHEIAIIASTALLLWALGQPLLVYLDITVLGVGSVLAFGRAGCLLVGCCHGRPHRWGVCYRAKHAAAGFPVYLTGVRLFPIQALELLLVVVVLIVGTAYVLRGDRPGEALTWYVAVYGAGRFCLEFARGDAGRRYFAGFSEAQWTSAVLMCAAAVAERVDLLPFHVRDVLAAAGVVAAMAVVAARRRFLRSPVHRLRRADHLKEVAEAIERAFAPTASTEQIHVSRTSLGIQISGGRLGGVDHYALSAVGSPMTDETAATVAELILELRRHPSRHDLIRGREGVFHLVADSGQDLTASA
jgi:prolipoprotein diacylglyceryltransferase